MGSDAQPVARADGLRNDLHTPAGRAAAPLSALGRERGRWPLQRIAANEAQAQAPQGSYKAIDIQTSY